VTRASSVPQLTTGHDSSRHRREVLEQTAEFVRKRLVGEPTGHDWWHADRVRRLARRIAEVEAADLFVVELAALLHDVADYKFTGSHEDGPRVVRQWLTSLRVDGRIIEATCDIIAGMSFRGAKVAEQPLSLEGRCVQDADRLDAIGAIGVARTFAYGGWVGRPIHDPDHQPVLHETAEAYTTHTGTTINHFHEKLLLLRDRFSTETGRLIAARRHEFMVDFLSRFEEEWAVTDT
jgi:uncharacterized protein